MDREQIVKALECCTLGDCYPCHYGNIGAGCRDKMCGDALSLINELTEENERLKELGTTKEIEKEFVRRQTKADTVRKMQERFNQVFGDAGATGVLLCKVFDQIAEEMLEVGNGAT